MVISSCKVITFAIGFIGTKSTPKRKQIITKCSQLTVIVCFLEILLKVSGYNYRIPGHIGLVLGFGSELMLGF